MTKFCDQKQTVDKGIEAASRGYMNTAFDCFRKAAKKGDPQGQFALGLCYANGGGVDRDLTQAVSWYTKAAEQGLADAQMQLADCYANGIGVEADREKARYWRRKAMGLWGVLLAEDSCE